MDTRRFLIGFAWVVLLSMLAVTGWAGWRENMFVAGGRMLRDPWSVATLCDAYFGFLWFWLWICFRERKVAAAVVWFLLVCGLGNMAMALYVLLACRRLPPGGGMRELLLGQAGSA